MGYEERKESYQVPDVGDAVDIGIIQQDGKCGFWRRGDVLGWGILRVNFINYGFMLGLDDRELPQVVALHGTGLSNSC